ncbi:MAG: 2-succinyl-5-enolpyruvyl-6-hydroxy-3-cyclohexene-1-carboxylic-acid synthase [Candidatus Neomarinimicrobiota bacterium]
MEKMIQPPDLPEYSALQNIYDLAEISVRYGVRFAVVSPGSRCAPLLLGFGKHPLIEIVSVSDERSAGYIALGIGQQTGTPAAVICTSGTAALNLAPAVTEAFYQNTALLVFTADRPPEWIDQWDGQAIRQKNLYEPHVKGSFDYSLDSKTKLEKRRLAQTAFELALKPGPGPVHINVPVREPFYPENADDIKFSPDIILEKQDPSPGLKTLKTLDLNDNLFKKILVLGGQSRLSPELTDLLSQLETPVIGDVTSNLHIVKDVIKCGDLIFKNADKQLKPDLLVTFGRSIVSKNLKLFLRKNTPSAHWHIGQGAIGDPFKSLTKKISMDPRDFFKLLLRRTSFQSSGYKKLLLEKNRQCRQTLKNMISRTAYNEFSAVTAILDSIPRNSVLHLGNSMPVRLANFCSLNKPGVEVWSNRGTSGIDGTVSTSMGHALADPKRLHTLIVGDIAFLYDRNALWLNRKLPSNLKIIILNNRGGGIFDFITGPANQGDLKTLFTTPHERDARLTAAEFGLPYTKVSNRVELSALKQFFERRSEIMEIFTETAANVSFYKKLNK